MQEPAHWILHPAQGDSFFDSGILADPTTYRHEITADDGTAGKPNPDPYLAAARFVGQDPGDCVVFEDSSAGGIAGETAGATVVAVGDQPWSTRPATRVDTLAEVAVRPNGSVITLIVDGHH